MKSSRGDPLSRFCRSGGGESVEGKPRGSGGDCGAIDIKAGAVTVGRIGRGATGGSMERVFVGTSLNCSLGCSLGCSLNCSLGCSLGCSLNCSLGCSLGCSLKCSLGCSMSCSPNWSPNCSSSGSWTQGSLGDTISWFDTSLFGTSRRRGTAVGMRGRGGSSSFGGGGNSLFDGGAGLVDRLG